MNLTPVILAPGEARSQEFMLRVWGYGFRTRQFVAIRKDEPTMILI
jgi:hypothetical protein